MSELKSLFVGPPLLTLGVAESLTSGNVQARIGAISGASKFFLGGMTAYTLEQKVQLLQVDRAVAEPVDCVSDEVARQMARGVCRLFGCSVGVATTGYAEPVPSLNVKQPFAWWSLCWIGAPASAPQTLRVGRVDCADLNRVAAQQRVADVVIEELLGAMREWRRSG